MSRTHREGTTGWTADERKKQQSRKSWEEEVGRWQSIAGGRRAASSNAPLPSISVLRTGHLGNLCSLIITLQRFHLSILPEESASCQTHRTLVNSINTALHFFLALLPLTSTPHPFASQAWGGGEKGEMKMIHKDIAGVDKRTQVWLCLFTTMFLVPPAGHTPCL